MVGDNYQDEREAYFNGHYANSLDDDYELEEEVRPKPKRRKCKVGKPVRVSDSEITPYYMTSNDGQEDAESSNKTENSGVDNPDLILTLARHYQAQNNANIVCKDEKATRYIDYSWSDEARGSNLSGHFTKDEKNQPNRYQDNYYDEYDTKFRMELVRSYYESLYNPSSNYSDNSYEEEQEQEQEEEDCTWFKKKRKPGRPKGSTKRKKEEQELLQQDDEAQVEGAASLVTQFDDGLSLLMYGDRVESNQVKHDSSGRASVRVFDSYMPNNSYYESNPKANTHKSASADSVAEFYVKSNNIANKRRNTQNDELLYNALCQVRPKKGSTKRTKVHDEAKREQLLRYMDDFREGDEANTKNSELFSYSNTKSIQNDDSRYMSVALDLAQDAACKGEVPVGAVIVDEDGNIVGRGSNCCISTNDPTAHAEIIALRDAGQNIGNYRLSHCTMYVTLEPCCMCAMAAVHARLEKIVFGAYDEKTGACGSQFDLIAEPKHNHHPEVEGGVLQERCSKLISDFFAKRRKEKKEHAKRKTSTAKS